MTTKTTTNAEAVLKQGGNESKTGDHWAPDLEGSYRDAKDKPDPSSIMQEQIVPDGWPGSGVQAGD